MWFRCSWDWSCREKSDIQLVKHTDTCKVRPFEAANDVVLALIGWMTTLMFLDRAHVKVEREVTLEVVHLESVSFDNSTVVMSWHDQVTTKWFVKYVP